MNKARSIKQNDLHDVLPNFRNLGVMLRILLLGNGLGLFAALFKADGWEDCWVQTLQISTLLAPVILVCVLLLWIVQPWLDRLAYWHGVLMVNLLVAMSVLLIYHFGGELFRATTSESYFFDKIRYVLLSVATCSLLLMYYRLRDKVLSRALDDARLQVLRARIRPHFLFNTINAVLGIVRSQPRKAETALEDMADLFRMAMSDAQELMPIKQEIQMCKQYLALEQLRIGERLKVDWQVDELTEDVKIPPLLLQPLLENAVYHGIEPLIEGGRITVLLRRNGKMLQIRVENPRPPRNEMRVHSGNKIALQNIRERLALLFDAEASYQVSVYQAPDGNDYYRVEISLPYMPCSI